MNGEQPILSYDTIVVSPRGITEAHGRRAVLFVPAAEIDGIALKFGRSDHRPIFSMTVGVVLLAVGVFGLVEIFLAPKGYRYELGMIAFGAIGGSLIFDTMKQRYFLEVRSRQGPIRLVFSKQAQRKEIQDFCAKVEAVYRHQIADDSEHQTKPAGTAS